jgi:diguanylate cyclase (GGDEF)-like protein
MLIGVEPPSALERLAGEIREAAWDLALECVEEGLRDDTVPSLARVGRLGQLGDVPTFVTELGRGLADPERALLRHGSPLAALARDHAREREALGFAPREIVTELLLLRRVLWRFVTARAAVLQLEDVLEVEQRLNDTIDKLVTECVVAYFERATTELSLLARQDPLTELLNHQAFTGELELEVERAKRYGHPLALVFFDIDRFKAVNDTLGHPEGDRVLRLVASTLEETLRRTDVAGRMGGDEFAAALVETEPEAAGHVLSRLVDRLDELAAAGKLPAGFSISPGMAQYPADGADADALFRAADARSYEVKRARSSAA